MSEDNFISLIELLNLAVGTPQSGVVNFRALHALLHALLTQMDIREMRTLWSDTPPDALLGVTAPKQDHHGGTEEEQHRGQREEQAASSPTRSSGPAELRSRIQTCENDVSRAMKHVEELHHQNDNLKEEMKELQQKVETEPVLHVEECCHRVDTLEKAVNSLMKYPDPEQLSKYVTWDALQSALLSKKEDLQKELINSEVVDPAAAVEATDTPLNNITAENAAPTHSSTPSSPDPVDDTIRPAAPSVPTVSGLISADARTVTEAPAVSGSRQQMEVDMMAASTPLTQKTSSSEHYTKVVEVLRNIGKLGERFSKLEADVAALEEEKVDQSQLTHLSELMTNKGSRDVSNNLMDQLNEQRALTDHLMSNEDKNSKLVSDVQKAILQLQAECEKLHETTRCLHDDNRQKQSHLENSKLVSDVQKAILQLQAECEKLHETTRCLHDDNRQKQSHLEELYKTMEELQEKKADRRMVERILKKADESDKVNRLQFDSATEQLYAMFYELLNKVTGQEQDWHKVIDRISTEMECKLNRIELDSVKKQLEDRWKNIHQKLQAQGAPEHEDAAGIRKQLADRFHCLSCDRPVVMHTPSQLVKLPSSGLPSRQSIRPFTVYALEQIRQHYRNERISKMADYSHLSVTRSSGGSHTVTSASQRRSGLQHTKHHAQTEVDDVIESEIDIIGDDGHIYKGRLHTPAIRNAETKLPTISTKDGKTKDKVRGSPSHKPAASPELHHPHSAKSGQCSRSASSSSGRDWPVSALGCTSQSSVTLASAAAESNTEPHADEALNP